MKMKSKVWEILGRQSLGIVLVMILIFAGLILPESESAFIERAEWTVVLDAGHGGFDCGAVGVHTKVKEDGLNLKIALMTRDELEKEGVRVIMTRKDENAVASTKDADMYKRRQIIESSGADVVVSIHMNISPDHSVSGPIVYFMEGSLQGRALAETLQQSLNDTLMPPRPRKIVEDSFFINRSGEMPSVIVECGFLSNAREEGCLRDPEYQSKVARAISFGTLNYLEVCAGAQIQ